MDKLLRAKVSCNVGTITGIQTLAHAQQQEFVGRLRRAFPEFFQGHRVLEVGSLDINGSVRTHFTKCSYLGLDVGPGHGVDVVCQGQNYEAPDGSFDVTISCETMEHNPFWRETFTNMIRLCRPGGLVVMTCASYGRPEHGTRRTTPKDAPLIDWDYYGNLGPGDFLREISIRESFSQSMFCRDFSFCDLFFAGFRAGASPPPNAAHALRAIRWGYALKNFKRPADLRKQALIRLIGEREYMAGPWRPWKRDKLASS